MTTCYFKNSKLIEVKIKKMFKMNHFTSVTENEPSKFNWEFYANFLAENFWRKNFQNQSPDFANLKDGYERWLAQTQKYYEN